MNLDDAVARGLRNASAPLSRIRLDKGTATNGAYVERLDGLRNDRALTFYGTHPARHPYHGVLAIPFTDERNDLTTFAELSQQLYKMDKAHPPDACLSVIRAHKEHGLELSFAPHVPYNALLINPSYSLPQSVLDTIQYASAEQRHAHPLLSRLLGPLRLRQHLQLVLHPHDLFATVSEQAREVATCPKEHPGDLAVRKCQYKTMFDDAYRVAGCAQYLPGIVVRYMSSDRQDILSFFCTLLRDNRVLDDENLQQSHPSDSTRRLAPTTV